MIFISSKISDGNMDFRFGDSKEVSENRKRFFKKNGVKNVVEVKQVHDNKVVFVHETVDPDNMADGIITNKRDIYLMLKVADCIPIGLYDPKHKAIGLIHVGFRGLEKGIIKNTVEKMKKNLNTNPKDLIVKFGPSIGPCHYRLDLWADAENQLISCGVLKKNIHNPKICTYENKEYFSHRRAEDQNLLIKTTILVGETWDEFEKNSIAAVSEIVSKRLAEIIQDIPVHFLQNLTIGYEPKWGSRGSGNDAAPPPQPELISVCIKEVKEVIRKYHGDKVSDSIAMIYGGRSTPERTTEILKDKNVEGLILGSACNTLQKTLGIIQAMQQAMGNRKKILHANFKAYNLPDSYQDYINIFQKLDDRFTIFISPPYTDLKEVKDLL